MKKVEIELNLESNHLLMVAIGNAIAEREDKRKEMAGKLDWTKGEELTDEDEREYVKLGEEAWTLRLVKDQIEKQWFA